MTAARNESVPGDGDDAVAGATADQPEPAGIGADADIDADIDAADRVWTAMRDLVHDYERQREVVEALGMSLAKVKALRRISTTPMTCKQLAARMLTDAPRASVLIDELVQRGLAVRAVDPDDRRVRIVRLTELGAAEAARATKILTRAPDAVREMAPGDLADLDRILRRFTGPGAGASD